MIRTEGAVLLINHDAAQSATIPAHLTSGSTRPQALRAEGSALRPHS